MQNKTCDNCGQVGRVWVLMGANGPTEALCSSCMTTTVLYQAAEDELVSLLRPTIHDWTTKWATKLDHTQRTENIEWAFNQLHDEFRHQMLKDAVTAPLEFAEAEEAHLRTKILTELDQWSKTRAAGTFIEWRHITRAEVLKSLLADEEAWLHNQQEARRKDNMITPEQLRSLGF